MGRLFHIITLGRFALFLFLLVIVSEIFIVCKNKILLHLNHSFSGNSDFCFFKRKYPIWVYLLILALIVNQVFYMIGDKTKLEGLYEVGEHTSMYHAQLSPKNKDNYIPVVVKIDTESHFYYSGRYNNRYINKLIFEDFEINVNYRDLNINSVSNDTVTASFSNDFWDDWDLIISRKALDENYTLPKLELKGDTYSFSKNSDIVHSSYCQYVKNIKLDNKLSFDDEEFIDLFSLNYCTMCFQRIVY